MQEDGYSGHIGGVGIRNAQPLENQLSVFRRCVGKMTEEQNHRRRVHFLRCFREAAEYMSGI